MFMTACSGGGTQFSQAPMSQDQAGLIVQGSAADTQKLISLSQSYRVISAKHQIYELKGITTADVKAAAPNVTVEQNKYYKSLTDTKKPSKKAELFRKLAAAEPGVEVQPEELPPALQGCNMEATLTPTVQIGLTSTILSESDTMNLGETVNFTGAPSTAPDGGALEIRWDILPPATSSIATTLSINPTLDLTPDGVGLWEVAVVAKDSTNACGLQMIGFLVTHNPEIEFATSDEAKPSLDINLFTHLKKIKAEEAWKVASGKGLKVAVLDSGLHYNHRAIKFNLAINEAEKSGVADADEDKNGFKDDVLGWDFANGDNKPFDDEGHGSHVSGLVASHIHGVARNATILPVKVLNAAGGGDVASIVAGIYYAVDNGAKVINASLAGLNTDIQSMTAAIAYAQSKNVVFVAASGNETLDLSLPGNDMFPGEIDSPNMVNVAATGIDDLLTSYSNFGRNEVDVAAPGGDDQEPIYSLATLNTQEVPYVGSGGTSMASPIVAGVVALMLEVQPDLSASAVRTILMQSGTVNPGLTDVVGSGRLLDAEQAVQMAAAASSDMLLL